MEIKNTLEVPVSDGTRMNAFLARPERPGRFPGLLVLQEAFGVNGYIRSVARRFAGEGFVAVAPELYHRKAPGFEGSYDDFQSVRPLLAAMTPEALEADLLAAYSWLDSDGQVQSGQIGCIGFCMGGRAAFTANALAPFKAAVSFYGAGIASQSLDKTPSLHAPMLFFWGGRDKNIPPEQIMQITQALREHKKTFTNVEFSDANHGFFCDVRASYDASASVQAWPLCLAFLKNHLASGKTG